MKNPVSPFLTRRRYSLKRLPPRARLNHVITFDFSPFLNYITLRHALCFKEFCLPKEVNLKKMKQQITSLLLLLVPVLLRADDFQDDVFSTDPQTETIALSATPRGQSKYADPSTGEMRTYSGMQVEASAYPLVAPEAEAAGVSIPQPETTNGEGLITQLGNSHWRLANGRSFTLMEDGTTYQGGKNRAGNWAVVGNQTIQLTNWSRKKNLLVLEVDFDVTTIRGFNNKRIALRVTD